MDLDNAIAEYERRGYRLDMIMPADNPHIAVVSKGGEMLRLTIANSEVHAEPFTGLGHPVIPPSTQEFVVTRANNGAWQTGRAGMQYRDLIPGRLGGRYVASHISIPNGGPVNDYVHHHRVRFQTIFVRKGWVRVVYEDQGEPFVMHEGDCVLQPPHIRHRVLEASKGLEVIEIGSPAEHETFRDHDLTLPTPIVDPSRNFSGQRFVHHAAWTAAWHDGDGYTYRDTSIAAATNDLASVRVLKLATPRERVQTGDLLFFYILTGHADLQSKRLGDHVLLNTDDCCVLPANADYTLTGPPGSEVLEVALPAIRSN